MKPRFAFHTKFGFTMLALITCALSATAQNWIQWKSADGGNDHYYALTLSATNWIAAEKQAVSWGGTLATITSSNEQTFINTTFLMGAFEHRPLWIGLLDRFGNTPVRRLEETIGFPPKVTFTWVTGETLSYTNWKQGEPNNTAPGENYVAINWEFSDNPPRGIKGDWNDTPLNGTTRYGGKTDGPYFGLVERETDPRLPVRRSGQFAVSLVLTIILLVILLLIWAVRSKRTRPAKTNFVP